MSWLDSLSLTNGPLNSRLRYRALCHMRAKMHTRFYALAGSIPKEDQELQRVQRAAEQLESMHRNADVYLRLR